MLEYWSAGVLDSDSARIFFALVNPPLQSSIIPIFPLELSPAVRDGGWGYLNLSPEFLYDLGDEEGENKKTHGKKDPEGNELTPVSGGPYIF